MSGNPMGARRLTALVTVLLCSCGAAGEDRTHSAPIVDVEPAAAKSKAPEDPEPLGPPEIVPGKSVGGITIGMSEDDVVRVLGKPEETSEGGKPNERYMSYQSKGLSFLTRDGQVATAFAYSGRKGGYETGEFAAFRGRTPEGISMGSTYEEVLRVYGKPTQEGALDLAPVPSRWLAFEDKGIGFDFVIATNELVTVNVFSPGP